MSSYILSIESITDIAESIRYILDNSSNSNCISLNTKGLKNQFRNCDGKSGFYQTRKIARVLYRFNDLAVSSRYDETVVSLKYENIGRTIAENGDFKRHFFNRLYVFNTARQILAN